MLRWVSFILSFVSLLVLFSAHKDLLFRTGGQRSSARRLDTEQSSFDSVEFIRHKSISASDTIIPEENLVEWLEANHIKVLPKLDSEGSSLQEREESYHWDPAEGWSNDRNWALQKRGIKIKFPLNKIPGYSAIENAVELFRNITRAKFLDANQVKSGSGEHVIGSFLLVVGSFTHFLLLALDMHSRSFTELRDKGQWYLYPICRSVMHCIEVICMVVASTGLGMCFVSGKRMLTFWNEVYMGLHIKDNNIVKHAEYAGEKGLLFAAIFGGVAIARLAEKSPSVKLLLLLPQYIMRGIVLLIRMAIPESAKSNTKGYHNKHLMLEHIDHATVVMLMMGLVAWAGFSTQFAVDNGVQFAANLTKSEQYNSTSYCFPDLNVDGEEIINSTCTDPFIPSVLIKKMKIVSMVCFGVGIVIAVGFGILRAAMLNELARMRARRHYRRCVNNCGAIWYERDGQYSLFKKKYGDLENYPVPHTTASLEEPPIVEKPRTPPRIPYVPRIPTYPKIPTPTHPRIPIRGNPPIPPKIPILPERSISPETPLPGYSLNPPEIPIPPEIPLSENLPTSERLPVPGKFPIPGKTDFKTSNWRPMDALPEINLNWLHQQEKCPYDRFHGLYHSKKMQTGEVEGASPAPNLFRNATAGLASMGHSLAAKFKRGEMRQTGGWGDTLHASRINGWLHPRGSNGTDDPPPPYTPVKSIPPPRGQPPVYSVEPPIHR